MSADRSESASTQGKFIVFEGGDGCGKSTQAQILAARIDAVHSREPGGTRVGERIRDVVLDPATPELADRTEALLMAADRAQHVAELIAPTIASGRHVVSDRHVASSLAYQGIGRGLGVESVLALNEFGVGEIAPDLVILLDVEPGEAVDRLGADLDRIESAGSELAERVRAWYREYAEANSATWVTVDGNGSPEAVSRRVAHVVDARLGFA